MRRSSTRSTLCLSAGWRRRRGAALPARDVYGIRVASRKWDTKASVLRRDRDESAALRAEV